MSNYKMLMSLPLEELAEYLVHYDPINIGDEGMDGEWRDFYVEAYTTPANKERYMDYEDAIAATVEWLKSDSEKPEK